jgi:hypothetical protein
MSPQTSTQITINISPELLAKLDGLTSDRDAALTEAVQLWCAKQVNRSLQSVAKTHKQRHDRDEAGWLV